jgi:methylmalonyl-CoA decarboxylase subunit alpha
MTQLERRARQAGAEAHMPRLTELAAWREAAKEMGGADAVARQHARGKLTARERLDLLLDTGSFVELGVLAQSEVSVPGKDPKIARAGGVVTGTGTIDGREVFVTADDATVVSGARGRAGGAKAGRIYQMALQQRRPLIALMEGSAGRVQDQMGSRLWAALGYDPHTTGFGANIDLSGVVPTVSAIMGSSVGGAAFIAGLSDFVPMVKNTSFLAVSGPPVVAGATGEQVSPQKLGGSEVHAAITGQIDYEATDDADCMDIIRRYLGYFPVNCDEPPPILGSADSPARLCAELLDIVPADLRHPYDMHRVIQTIVDDGNFFSLKRDYGKAVITGLARLGGESVGIVASQPLYMAGVIDDRATYKIIHFLDLCDAFHIPVIFLVDCPGFIIGKEWERRSMVTWVARALMAHRRLSVPKITVVLRKAYGLAYWIMGGKAMNPDLIAAWPTASFSLMAPEPAVNVIYQREIEAAEDRDEAQRRYLDIFRQQYAPDDAAKDFAIDDIIDPRDLRAYLTHGLEMVLPRRARTLGFRHPIYP